MEKKAEKKNYIVDVEFKNGDFKRFKRKKSCFKGAMIWIYEQCKS